MLSVTVVYGLLDLDPATFIDVPVLYYGKEFHIFFIREWLQ